MIKPTDGELLEIVMKAPALETVEAEWLYVLREALAKFGNKTSAEPLTHEQAKAFAAKFGNDPLNLIAKVEKAHGITH